MLDVKPFQQSTDMCGPAALKMVLEFFGVEKSEEELANMTDCKPEIGIEAEAMIDAARQLGFKTLIKDGAEFDDIRKYVLNEKIPVIVNWFSEDDGHYSVVVDINEKQIFLRDPEIEEIRKIPLRIFRRVWFDFRGDFISSKDDMIIRRMIVIYK